MSAYDALTALCESPYENGEDTSHWVGAHRFLDVYACPPAAEAERSHALWRQKQAERIRKDPTFRDGERLSHKPGAAKDRGSEFDACIEALVYERGHRSSVAKLPAGEAKDSFSAGILALARSALALCEKRIPGLCWLDTQVRVPTLTKMRGPIAPVLDLVGVAGDKIVVVECKCGDSADVGWSCTRMSGDFKDIEYSPRNYAQLQLAVQVACLRTKLREARQRPDARVSGYGYVEGAVVFARPCDGKVRFEWCVGDVLWKADQSLGGGVPRDIRLGRGAKEKKRQAKQKRQAATATTTTTTTKKPPTKRRKGGDDDSSSTD